MGQEQPFSSITVIGAGTMGAGIAQACALAGIPTTMFDVSQDVLDKALARIEDSVEKAVEKQKAPSNALEILKANLSLNTQLKSAVENSDLVIEAIPENMTLKKELFEKLDALCPPSTGFASNTSSLSITEMAAMTKRPEQFAGMHFFNPVALMKLVEIISGQNTNPNFAEKLSLLAKALGKTPVPCKDSPGFIVNRVARPFYGEALRILGENLADVETIDKAMRELGGFKMGPFELMDLIGLDINYAVTQSVYHAYHQNPRFEPHPIQKELVESGNLGRKTGQGFYKYDVSPPTPAATQPPLPHKEGGQKLSAEEIVDRVYAMLANEAAYAIEEGVATAPDIDTAMKLGTNYPIGPSEWADKKGKDKVYSILKNLENQYSLERYRPCQLLNSSSN